MIIIRIWQQKAYVVQGCGERLQKVKEDFMNYNVEQLVASASVRLFVFYSSPSLPLSRSSANCKVKMKWLVNSGLRGVDEDH
jgi:hypothetical protein